MGCTASSTSQRGDNQTVCIEPVQEGDTAPTPTPPDDVQPVPLERRQTIWRRFSTIRRQVAAEADEGQSEFEALTRVLLPPQHNFFRYYTLGRKIADGTSAQVRLCSNLATKTEYAVKIFPKSYPVEKFLLEVAIMKAACTGSCSNLVEYFDAFRDHRYLFLVMEYCRGDDILTSIVSATENITEQQLSEYVAQVIRALDHLHSRGILHRDVRPQNILMANSNSHQVKLMDLGSGCELDPFLQLSEPCGIAYYFSPEMIEGAYDRKSDIWAAGVTLYMLLFGYRPFSGASDQELFRQILETEPSYRNLGKSDSVPSKEAVEFCQRLLMKDPRRRLSSDEALRDPWITRQVPAGRGSGNAFELSPCRYVPPKSLIRIARAETLDLSSGELKGLRAQGRSIEPSHRPGNILSGLGSSVSHAMTRAFGNKPGEASSVVNSKLPINGSNASTSRPPSVGLERASQANRSVCFETEPNSYSSASRDGSAEFIEGCSSQKSIAPNLSTKDALAQIRSLLDL